MKTLPVTFVKITTLPQLSRGHVLRYEMLQQIYIEP